MEAILLFNEMEGNNTPPPPPIEPGSGKPENTGDVNVLMAILSYFGIFALIPLFVEKEDEFIQFHAKQGTTLIIAEVIVFFGLALIAFIPFIGCITGVVEIILALFLFVFHIIFMVKASKGEWYKIPYIYEWSLKIFK